MSTPVYRTHRVTMEDVARHAGVSKASVSRFIGEGRGLLTEAIAERIENAIGALGYRPNQMARALKRGRTRLLGMLVADIRNPYSIAVMHGVETACRQHGYSLVVSNTDRDPEQERRQLAALRSYNVEGLIVNTLGQHVEQLRQLQHELPIVLVDRKVEGLGSDLVGLANAHAVGQALDHLAERGYRDLVLVSEPILGTSSRRERAQAFEQWLAGHANIRGQLMETGADLGHRLGAWHAAAMGPGAVFCANGLAALAATLALRELGVRLFDDIGLVALDDLQWYPLVGTGITALAQPTQAIGEQAFQCLLQRLQGERCPPRDLSLEAQLIIRGSTPDRT
ncbi:LacI family DNA-binding transcriptional regulator [Pseudomonas typographi]|uniref:LacI family DNA-binding transcriptional regulator n=1 Tax=Pseudomonas typographi TaxID=2715964 RepID=A0ABR7Z5K8_9PSED|nr:LacI family DNA-binding transcriptional regulator [Pseudomonas typographi]MBD1589451.1 LacI family DNA-binding transcriptional regulator [Pseudomonas typographi]MBD1600692.1 LacI family DNA-binding transcriptional regulator [Pseudomonas typographi]